MRTFCSALVLVFLATPAVAKKKKSKGSCASAAQVTSDVWKYGGPIVTEALKAAGPAGVTVSEALKAAAKGVKAWNKLVGKKSWATIGPRQLSFGKWQKGRVVGTTERVFISPIPALRPVTVEFHKLEGKGEVRVVVCTKSKGKKAKRVKAFKVGAKTAKGKVQAIKIKNAKEQVIKVVIHGKKMLKSIRYKVRAKM